MHRLTELLEHPGEFMHRTSNPFTHRPKSSIGGIVLLAVAILGFVWMWPEIQRYMKIRRM